MHRFYRLTPEAVPDNPDFNQGLLKIFQSRFAQIFLITIRLKIFNRGLIDPDRIFNRDHDRG
jgi:hypothetical protein